MPARTGAQFLQRLRDRPRDLWLEGERVVDPVEHPAFRSLVRSVAALYDMQHDPAVRDEMTYVSPTTAHRVGLSFLMPHTHDDLVRVRTQTADLVHMAAINRALGFEDQPEGVYIEADVADIEAALASAS